MSLVVTISASPAPVSRSQRLAARVGGAVAARGFQVQPLNVRDLPAEDLLSGRGDSAGLRHAVGLVEQADGVVVVTPVYKASYTGVLKTFLDVLPQFGLSGKVVLPLATGGTLAHVLAIDYALRPVLSALGAQHVVTGLFILDKLLSDGPDDILSVDPELGQRLDGVVADFVHSLERRALSRAA